MTGSNKLQLGVLLDRDTIDAGGDIDFAVLESIFSQWRAHDYTLSDDVVERIDGASVIISNKVMLDENALRSVPGLKLVCIAATGTNNVDLEAAKALGIPVCNVRGYATPTVSQHALALILALSTRLIDYHQAVRSGRWQQARELYEWVLPLLHLDIGPKFVQQIERVEALMGGGSAKVRAPRLQLSEADPTRVEEILEKALEQRPQL